MKPIKITCEGKDLVGIDKIESIQGELKKINPESMKKLKQSIIKHGFSFPVFVWKNKTKYYSIDGVHRVKALKELCAEGYDVPVSVPVAYINARDRKQAKTLLLAVSSQYAKFTEEGFTEFIKDLDLDDISNDIDIPSIDIDSILNAPPETEDDDEIPDEVDPVTKLGDLWELGHHRVLCGDSTKIEDVERLMDVDNSNYIMITDPPFDMNIEFLKIYNPKIVLGGDRQIIELSNVDNYFNYFLCHYYEFGFARSRTMPQIAHRIIGVYGDVKYKSINGNILKTVIKAEKIGKVKEKYEKPVIIYDKIINHYVNDNEIVVDLFLHSGTALIACEKTNRICYGMELEEHYCDVIVNRYKDWCEKNERTPVIKLNGNPHVMAKDTK